MGKRACGEQEGKKDGKRRRGEEEQEQVLWVLEERDEGAVREKRKTKVTVGRLFRLEMKGIDGESSFLKET